MAQSIVESEFRVSFRELKEESYRALRQAGYPWGVAQVAGRCAGVAQVCFGVGLSAILRDATRWGVAKRAARHKTLGNTVVISARGMSWATVGPLAVAAALGERKPVVWVRGSKVGAALASVVWDIKFSSAEPVVWGSKTASGWDVFQVGADGDVFSSVVSSERLGKTPSRATWFVCLGGAKAKKLILAREEKSAQVMLAHQLGVTLGEPQWNSLERLSKKFLVPE